ncbi:hypothetical protein LHJ74_25055 [Streptomyces sp. N2-109]|uniref:DUF7144 domain-containing protein n=1 Tax=Streptomyces gossypii TaxID=2883101 RepID=A0ABT2JZ10_9ACTN|nr:hypothetical protein [Streptomyces gossypii]MCT2593137.1 hypothetical protein [Streptomyces gossypii]
MADAAQNTGRPTRQRGGAGSSWASGGTVFAGVLMLVQGVFGILSGIAAVAEDDVYTRVGDYVFELNLTTWGWIHLILGILIAVTGWGVLKGSDWARGVGVGIAALVVIAQFMWLPYHPLWSIVSIALAVFVIWALCTDHGRTSPV